MLRPEPMDIPRGCSGGEGGGDGGGGGGGEGGGGGGGGGEGQAQPQLTGANEAKGPDAISLKSFKPGVKL